MLVVVYGTLKQGHSNYRLHLEGHRPIVAAEMRLPYQMFGNGEYPMLVASREKHPITLEVFEVTEEKLSELDALELPYGYRRDSLFLPDLDRRASIYLYPGPPPAGFQWVESGNWHLETEPE